MIAFKFIAQSQTSLIPIIPPIWVPIYIQPLSKSLVKRHQKAREVPLPQINTLDRKILQELKQSMLARSAQFTLKNNAKLHPFPSDEVPYPRSYDHKCLDTDVWETVFCEQYCGNITFHTFDVPPTKVYVSVRVPRCRSNRR